MSQETVKHTPGQDGLTKREYFAALVLQGIIANDNAWNVNEADKIVKDCERVVAYADHLIATISKAENL